MNNGNRIETKVGIVVPTMGTRNEMLIQCLSSIRSYGLVHIAIVAPDVHSAVATIDSRYYDMMIQDPETGLVDAINLGLNSMPKEIVYLNWLGDDDLLEPDTLSLFLEELEQDEHVSLVYGNCTYINESGSKVWKNSFGQFAARILKFGPCLIPQPGALFRRSTFLEVGGLRSNYGWAFDYDLFVRFANKGKIKYIDCDVASFRWHSNSLTVSQRKKSVNEASRVRMSNYSKGTKALAFVWEPIVKLATLHAPKLFERS